MNVRQIPGSDRDGGYGWISIALHWIAALAILVLLFAGDSIATVGDQARRTHTTVASAAWLFLAARIVWRLLEGHPPPHGRGGVSHWAGFVVHYVLLGAIALMLVSGPLAGWAGGAGFHVFDLHVPGSDSAPRGVYTAARIAHIAGAVTLAVGTTLHVAGVLKHMFIDRDHTLDRIMTPPLRSSSELDSAARNPPG